MDFLVGYLKTALATNIAYHAAKNIQLKEKKSSVTYWMNLLQKINTSLNVFVSLNPYIIPSKSLIYKKIIYEHPIFNTQTNEAQKKMIEIQGKNNIFYAGAWLRYGFHEDGIMSAVNISSLLNIKIPWKK